MRVEIKRLHDSIIHTGDFTDLRAAVTDAIREGIGLGGADLRGADLRGARLGEADLRGAYLRGADLREADLDGALLRGARLGEADLRWADLRWALLDGADLRWALLDGADLRGAYLRGACLRGACLRGADLDGADLRWALLDGADLRGAYLRGACLPGAYLPGADLGGADLGKNNLEVFRRDVEHVLFCHPHEAAGVLAAIREGRVDGSCYAGDCACLVGTIANIKGCSAATLETDPGRPAEVWFTQFVPGDTCTPENHKGARITCEWIQQWIERHGPASEFPQGARNA